MKDRIAQIMNHEQMTQATFAEAINSNAATLSNILRGTGRPTLDIVNKICDRFPDVNLTWLITGTGEMFKEGSPSKSQNTSLFPEDSLQEASAEVLGHVNNPQTLSTPSQAPSSPALVKIVDKTPRRVTEICVYYDDNTFETFVPKK